MKREIFEVYAKIVDANGAYSTLSGYPKVFDSKLYDNDIEKARKRAYGEYHEVLGALCKRDDRQQQIAMILRGSDGIQIEKTFLGAIADIPDPTYLVTVNDGTGSGNYIEGAGVNIVANTPEEGMQFVSWEGAENLTFIVGGINSLSATFRMPKQAVSLTATYEEIPEPELES